MGAIFWVKNGYVGAGGEDKDNPERIQNYTIQTGGVGEDKFRNEATQLPVRIITLGGVYDGDAYLWGHENAQTLRPMTFPAK